MRFFNLLLTFLLLSGSFFPIAASASCPEPQLSQGGAELYLIGPNIRVRVQGEDVGLKLQMLGEDFVRRERALDSNAAVLIVGRTPRINVSVGARYEEIVSVLKLQDMLIVSTPSLLMVKDAGGKTICSQPSPSLVSDFVRKLEANGAQVDKAYVSAVSEDAFAAALGM
jgi:hypothetical protein